MRGKAEYEPSVSGHSVIPEGHFAVLSPLPDSYKLSARKGEALIICVTSEASVTEEIFSCFGIARNNLLSLAGGESFRNFKELEIPLAKLSNSLNDTGMMRLHTLWLLKSVGKFRPEEPPDVENISTEDAAVAASIKKYLIEHLSENTAIGELAVRHGMTPVRFNEVFRRIYKDTPYSYIKKYKMEIAAERLASTNDLISEIGSSVGYKTASKFTQAFYDSYGMLPKEYRSKNRI